MADPKAGDKTAIQVHYIKSNYFRVIYAEGAYGGVNSHGNITFALYNERAAIPRRTEIPVEMVDDHQAKALGQETTVFGKKGIVRELEVEVSLSLSSAQRLHAWLGEHIKSIVDAKK